MKSECEWGGGVGRVMFLGKEGWCCDWSRWVVERD